MFVLMFQFNFVFKKNLHVQDFQKHSFTIKRHTRVKTIEPLLPKLGRFMPLHHTNTTLIRRQKGAFSHRTYQGLNPLFDAQSDFTRC